VNDRCRTGELCAADLRNLHNLRAADAATAVASVVDAGERRLTVARRGRRERRRRIVPRANGAGSATTADPFTVPTTSVDRCVLA